MTYIDFEEDSNYYRGKRSVELFKKKTDNNVDIDMCNAVLNNYLLEPNDCKLLWNADPNSTMRILINYDGSTSYNPTFDWGSIVGLHANVIDNNINISVFEEQSDNRIIWIPPNMATNSVHSLSQPSLSIESPKLFLDFLRSLNNFQCYADEINESISESIIEVGDPNYSPPPDFPTSKTTVSQQFGTNAISYLKLKEKLILTINNIWADGRIITNFSLRLIVSTLERHEVGVSMAFVPNRRVIFKKGISSTPDFIGTKSENGVLLGEIEYYSFIRAASVVRNENFYKSILISKDENLNIINTPNYPDINNYSVIRTNIFTNPSSKLWPNVITNRPVISGKIFK